MEPLANGYPWSVIAVGVAMGMLGVFVFRDVRAGLAGGALSMFAAWFYWRPEGRGRRVLERFKRELAGPMPDDRP